MPMNVALVAQIRNALETSKRAPSDAARQLGVIENALRCLNALVADEKHCNYANYETFLVKLAIDNSKGTKQDALELARANAGERMALADALKDYVETWTQAGKANTLAGDLLGAALGSVDWRELAGELAGEVAEGVE